MEPHCIPFTEIPHTTALFSDYLYKFSRLAKFFAHDPFDSASFAAAARSVSLDSDRRRAVADALAEQNRRFGAGRDTEDNIARLHDGALAVVTGQQVGLFGGPSYSVWKALTAIRLAERLTAEGRAAVPIFWLATEDHDFAEVNHCFLLGDRQGGLALRDSSTPPEHAPVGRVAFGRSIEELRRQAASLWPKETAAEAERLLEGYAPGKTYAEAFARLFLRLFAGTGLIVLDPLDPALHALSRPLFRRALEEADGLRAAIRQRDRELAKAGYHVQVRLRENATLLFLLRDGRREPLRRRSNGRFVAGEEEFSLPGLLGAAEQAPERFSANVLLRPIVQDWLLPTVAYVAGPNEIAYFAQASTLYEKLLGRMPVIYPRVSVTLIDARARRLLEKYKIGLPDLFSGAARLRERLAERHLPRALSKRLEEAEKAIEKSLAGSAKELKKLDPTLAGAATTSRRKMLYQFDKLRRQAARAQAERTGILEQHLESLTTSLYPESGLQERRVNFLSFVARQGLPLVARLHQEVGLPCCDHQVIFL